MKKRNAIIFLAAVLVSLVMLGVGNIYAGKKENPFEPTTDCVAIIATGNGFACRYMSINEWNTHVDHHTLPNGEYYYVNATVNQLNDLKLWGNYSSIQEFLDVLRANNINFGKKENPFEPTW